MKQVNYLQLIAKQGKFIALSALLAASVSIWICGVIAPALYEAKVELLVIQKENDNIDSYAAQKSAEKLGNNLSKIVYSSDFQNKVLETGLLSGDIFSTSSAERKQQWEEMVKAQMIPETGIIKIFGYASNQETATNIVLASSQVLTENAAEYHGAGDSVVIKVIDSAIVSELPAKPNIILNTLVALVMGFVGAIAVVIVSAEMKDVKAIKREDEVIRTQSEDIFPVEQTYETESLYNVLDFNTFPNFEMMLREKADPVTMYDHIA